MEAWFVYTAAFHKAYCLAYSAALGSLNCSLHTSAVSFKHNWNLKKVFG